MTVSVYWVKWKTWDGHKQEQKFHYCTDAVDFCEQKRIPLTSIVCQITYEE